MENKMVKLGTISDNELEMVRAGRQKETYIRFGDITDEEIEKARKG